MDLASILQGAPAALPATPSASTFYAASAPALPSAAPTPVPSASTFYGAGSAPSAQAAPATLDSGVFPALQAVAQLPNAVGAAARAVAHGLRQDAVGVKDMLTVPIHALINAAMDSEGSPMLNAGGGENSAAARNAAMPPLASTSDRLLAGIPPEQRASALRGLAVTAGFAAGGLVGDAVRTVGAHIIAEQALRGSVAAAAAAGTARGVSEGAAFGAVFGALKPLDDDADTRGHSIMANAIGAAIGGGVLNGLGAVVAARAGGALSGAQADAMRAGLNHYKEDPAAAFKTWLNETMTAPTPLPNDAATASSTALQPLSDAIPGASLAQMQRPVAPIALTDGELAAQAAAGSASQASDKLGFWKRTGDAFSGAKDIVFGARFPDVKSIDQDFHATLMRVGAAQDAGRWFGSRAAAYVERVPGATDDDADLFWRGLLAARGRQITGMLDGLATRMEQDGILRTKLNGVSYDGNDIIGLRNSVSVPQLSADENAAFYASGAIRKMIGRFEDVVAPTVQAVRARNGMLSPVDQELPFITLMRAGPEDYEAGLRTVGDPLAGSAAGRGSGGRDAVFSTRTTPGAKMALGQAPAYLADGREILSRMMGIEQSTGARNELTVRVIAADWAQKLEDGEAPPRTITANGKEYPAQVIDLKGRAGVLARRFLDLQPGASAEPPVLQGTPVPADRLSTALMPHLLSGEASPGAPFALTPTDAAPSAPGASTALTAQGAPSALGAPGALPPGALESAELEHPGGVVPGEVGSVTLGRYAVPKPVALAWEQMLNPLAGRPQGSIEQLALWNKFGDLTTSLQLATPAEATVHMLNQLGVLSGTPGIGDSQDALTRIVSRFVPWFGGRAGALREIFDHDSPESMVLEARIAQLAGSARAFQSDAEHGLPGLLGGMGLERAAALARAPRNLMFGLPGEGGAFGFDMRARVALLRAQEIVAKRPLTDAEMMDGLSGLGVYEPALRNNLQNGLIRSKLNAFASTSLPIMGRQVAQFFGKASSALPQSVLNDMSTAALWRLRSEVLWRGTVGTAAVAMLAQHALTGTWPWHNEQDHKADIMVGRMQDGRAVYMPLPSGMYRAFNVTGMRAAYENFGEGALNAAGVRAANDAITYGIAGPPAKMAFTALTGRALNLTDEGLRQVVPPQASAMLDLKERAFIGAGTANQTFANLFGVGPVEMLPGSFRVINALAPGMKLGRTPERAAALPVLEQNAKIAQVAGDRVSKALQQYPGDPSARFGLYQSASADFPSAQRDQALSLMRRMDMERRRSTARAAAKAGAAP